MGRIVTLTHSGQMEEHEHSGPFIEYLLEHFPDGFGGQAVLVQVNGVKLETADYDTEINAKDEVIIRLAPAGLEALTIGIIAAVVGAVAAVASLALTLLTLDRGGANQQSTSSPYSVEVRANRAELGAVVPVRYGETIDTPHFASQSYRFFENHEEVRVYLLTLGAGHYDVDDVLIGDAPINSLPAGTASFEVYTPDDHQGLAGIIGEDFGVCENVATSGAVENQELRDRVRADTGVRRADIRDNNTVFFRRARDLANGAIRAGDTLIISAPRLLVGTYTIAEVGPDTIRIEGFFPGPNGDIDGRLEYRIEAQNEGELGPFPASPPGTVINLIEYDVEMPIGQQIGEDDPLAVRFILTIQRIDDEGIPIGAPVIRTRVEEDTTTDFRRYTFRENVADGRYQVSLRIELGRLALRNFIVAEEPITANDRAVVNWTGLKGFIVQPDGAPSFTGQTVMAMTLTGTQAISSSSQTQVFVRTTSLLKNIETGQRERSSNPADIIADLWTNDIHGARQSEATLDMDSLLELRRRSEGLPGWNGIFDDAVSVQDALVAVPEPYQARPYRRRTSLGVVFDDVKPVRRALVLPETRLRDSLRVSYNWVGDGDNDGIEVRYRDPRDFEELQVQWPPTEGDARRFVANDFPPAPTNVRGFEVRGVTNTAQAEAHARYLYNTRIARNTNFRFTVELEALGWEPFDRLGIISPDFDWGDGREIVGVSGRLVELDTPVPAGNYAVAFRLKNGGATDVMSAIADGGAVLSLSRGVPSGLAEVGSNWPPMLAILPRGESIKDVLVTSIQPGNGRAVVNCVNYDPDAPTLEDLRNA